MSSRIRQSAYKKSLVSKEACLLWSHEFSTALKPLLEIKNTMTEAEFAASYVIKGIQLLRPRLWRGGAHKEFSFEMTPSETINTFLSHSLRSIPVSVNRSLYSWFMGKYPLKLSLDIPTELEVLEMQTRGLRCVSCITDPKLMETYILNERDALSFALHDLLHADHFFKSPELLRSQVSFSRWLLKLYNDFEFQAWLKSDAVFEKEFFYAGSDMNSHPAHLAKYFKWVLNTACQRTLSRQSLDYWLAKSVAIGGFGNEFLAHFEDLNSVRETENTLRFLSEALDANFDLEGSAAADNQEHRGVSLVENCAIISSARAVVSDRLHAHT